VQLYYLIAIYTFICTGLMFAFTRTPLGRMLNAVRDNPERVEFVGYNTQFVRYFAFIASGFFMGIAGGLAALNFEIVTAEVVGANRSGAYLLFTFLGGAIFFFGPIIGAVLLVLALVLLSELTQAWLLYLGLVFTFMVMFAPGGISSLVMMNLRVAKFGKLGGLLGSYAALALTGFAALVGLSAMIEMLYHLQLNQALGPNMKFMGLTLNAGSTATWLCAAAVMLLGALAFEFVRRDFAKKWGTVQEEIERLSKAQESKPELPPTSTPAVHST
jgi:branched-chain amino acid transport system permease protein